MIGVLVMDLGLLLLAAGVLGLVRPLPRLGLSTRRRGLALAAAGALVIAIAALLPAPERRAATIASRLDEVIPVWQFDEQHETRVHADPARVEAALRAVSAHEIRFFRLLTWLRSPRLPGSSQPESILAAPADEPILAVALRSGFALLAEEPGRELVIGTLVIVPKAVRRLPAAERAKLRAEWTGGTFHPLAPPGYAEAVMNFRWTDEGGGWTRVTTETRVFATDPHARRRFAVYWRLIYPGSSLIRRTWLAAIRERAEAAE